MLTKVSRYVFSRLIGILITLGGLLAGPAALADDLIISRSMLEDKTGTLTIADVEHRKFDPIEPTLSQGYTKSVHWLRLQLRPPASGDKAVLRIGSAFLDDVRLYEADVNRPLEWVTRVTGDHHPFAQRDRVAIGLGFDVKVTAPITTFYLRIETTSPSLFNVVATSQQTSVQLDRQASLIRNIFIGLMLWALIWTIDQYIVVRRTALGLFAIYQSVFLFYGLSVTGNIAPFIPADFALWTDRIDNTLRCAVPFTFILFSRALFKPYKPSRPLFRGLTLLLLVFPLQLAAMSFGYTLAALLINSYLSLIAAWYCVLVAFTVGKRTAPGLQFLQVLYFVLAVFPTIAVFVKLGWLTALEINPHSELSVLTYGVVFSSLICSLMYRRLRHERLQAKKSTHALKVSEQALVLERTYKEKAETQARTDFLTGIFNRRYFIELAQRELDRATRRQEPFSLLMIDIDHFKSINDTWGHNSGDLVLQKVTLLIRDCLRDIDLFGRMGGEEFAAALPGADARQALQVAQRIRTAVESAAIPLLEGNVVSATVSIGMAELNSSNNHLDTLLHQADQALYQAKRGGRNLVMQAEPT